VISVNESGTSSAPQFAADNGDGGGAGLIDPMQQKIVIIARRPIEAGQEITYGMCFDAFEVLLLSHFAWLAFVSQSQCCLLAVVSIFRLQVSDRGRKNIVQLRRPQLHRADELMFSYSLS
jgi:hypothetical protein